MENNKILRVLIVEDNEKETQDLVESANSADGIQIVGTTNNSTDAIALIKSLLPDVIILDLELSHDGSGNGFEVLYAIKETPLSVVPYIFVTTNNTSTQTTNIMRQLGADFVQYKHDVNYSAKKVISILNITKSHILDKNSYTSTNSNTSDTLNDKMLTDRISLELNFVGIPNKLVGHTFLSTAIKLALSNYEGNLCKKVALIHHTSQNNVEHSIKYAIDSAWSNYDSNNIAAHYTGHYSHLRGTPSLKEFVYYYADKIKGSL